MQENKVFAVLPRHDEEWHRLAAPQAGLELVKPITLEDLTGFGPATLYEALRDYLSSQGIEFGEVAIACDRLKVAAPLASHQDVKLLALDRHDREYRHVVRASWRQDQRLALPEEGLILFGTNSDEPEPESRLEAYAEEIACCRNRLTSLYPRIAVEEFDIATGLISATPEDRAVELDEVMRARGVDALFCTNFFLTTSRTLAGMQRNVVGVEISYHPLITDLSAGYNYDAPHLVAIEKEFEAR